MIATLSSFETQFKPVLIEKGKALFEQGKVGPLKDLNPVWQAEVTDTKVYKEVTVRAVDGKVTDIFCPCGPAICRHVIALMFTLRQELRITPEIFDPAMLIPPPPPAHVTLGRKLNDLIYASRAAGTKDGELEELGASFNMKDPDVPKLRAMVHKGWFFPNERSKYPILNGAKRMLGAAILKYEQKDYRFVFDVARAILTEICSTEIAYYGTSPTECCRAAVELLNELCTAPEVPADLKKEVFSRVLFASGKKLYELYHEELLAVLRNPLLDRELQELAAADLGNAASEAERSSPLTLHAQSHLLEQLGRTEEQEQLMLNNPHHFRRELIEKAYADKDYDTVKRLAREGLGGSVRDAAQWTEWLFKIAQEEGDVNYIRSFHKTRYFGGGWPVDSYEACRSTYTKEEWDHEVLDWRARFGNIKNLDHYEDISALARLYIREGMADKLLALLKEHCSYALAKMAEPTLIVSHSEELMGQYREWLIWYAGRSTQRDNVIELREMMKEIRRSSPQGKKMVKELVPHLFELHPTWKVFREELSKL